MTPSSSLFLDALETVREGLELARSARGSLSLASQAIDNARREFTNAHPVSHRVGFINLSPLRGETDVARGESTPRLGHLFPAVSFAHWADGNLSGDQLTSQVTGPRSLSLSSFPRHALMKSRSA